MNRVEYPNREALDKALRVYLESMYSFVSECLDEKLIRDVLHLPSDSNIEEEIEVKDIAHLIRTWPNWNDYFKEKFKVIDRDDIRYYDARSVTSLIVEGRNQVSHQRLRELDPEFTRTQLFLIAEVLGKISMSDAQHEVEVIRDKLFDDTTEQRVTTAVEAEQAKYEKSITEVKERLTAAEEDKEKLLKQRDDNTAELDRKKEELEKLSEQLVGLKLSEKENEKRLKSTSKQLEKVQATHSTCKKRLTSTEAEKDDYKERLKTASKQLDEVNERLSITSDQFLAIKTERDTSNGHLASIQRLLIASTINDQSVFPSLKTDSAVRVLDRRGKDSTGKRNYLLNLLEQKQPTVIYVQSEDMINLLLERVVPEKADLIEKHSARTSEAEEAEILEKLEKGELIALVSDTTFSTLTPSHCVEHFVFCHLVPGLDEFFKRCEPAFTSEKNTYLHLIYNNKADIEVLDQWLTQKYPDREVLEKMYRELEKLIGVNGDFITPEKVYNELDIAELGITELGLKTGFAIFEELKLLERDDEGIRLLPPSGRKLEEASEIYRRGEQMEAGIAKIRAFQLEQPIEKIWEEILEKLNVDSKQILRESNIYKVDFKVLETKVDVQSTIGTEQDKVTPPTPEVWPQRTLSAFDALRQRASKNLHNTNNFIQSIDESTELNSPFANQRFREVEDLDWKSPGPEEYDDYENRYDLAMQFGQEHGVNALKQGIALLIENQGNPDYDFTEDETNMLRAFQHALTDFQTQSKQSSEVVEGDNTADGETTEASHLPKPPRANATVTEEQVRVIRSRSAAGEANSELVEEDSKKKHKIKQSEFWQPIRDGEFGALFAGKPVPVRDDGWISKRIRGVELILSFRQNRSYVSFLCRGENRIERRDEIIALFPEADYDYFPHESPQRAGFRFPVINKGKDHPEDWDEIRKKLVAMGTDIYNKIDESNL